jgi:hypothetical protein
VHFKGRIEIEVIEEFIVLAHDASTWALLGKAALALLHESRLICLVGLYLFFWEDLTATKSTTSEDFVDPENAVRY